MHPELTFDLAWESLPEMFPGFSGHEHWLPLLRHHATLIEQAAERVRVTSVPGNEAVRRQYAESLELLRIVEQIRGPQAALADVGSGGGFPGLVIAAVRPEMSVHLIEPLQKRAAFLTGLAKELRLGNVAVYAQRAEDAGRGALRDAIPLITARAVAELRELLEYTAPLAAPGGLLALPKGSGFGTEFAAAARACSELACEFLEFVPMRPEVSTTVGVALFRKTAATPVRYPRRPGMPGKRPL